MVAVLIGEAIMFKSQEEIDEAFRERYKQRNGGQNKFIALDGIINSEKFEKANPKILWVLKESTYSDTPKDFNMRELLVQLSQHEFYQQCKKTFEDIVIVSYGIIKGKYLYSEIPEIEEIKSVLEEIAFINIKKSPGGTKTYNPIISKHFGLDRDLLKAQIDYINPDLIIFAVGPIASPELFKMMFGDSFEHIGGPIGRVNGKHKRNILCVNHPAAPANAKTYFDYIIELVKRIDEIKG
jgi:hypothetical protein